MYQAEQEEDALIDKFPSRELKFENPYGHIAAVEWGNRDAPNKILCSHGWLDNLGTFRGLVPALLNYTDNAQMYHVIAFDMPGVGLSSHLPTGATYTYMTTILEMRRIVKKMNWKRVTLISHSLGAQLSYLYCCLYPKQVETLIAIDLPEPGIYTPNSMATSLIDSIEEHFKCEYSHGDDPEDNMGVLVYSERDAIDRIMKAHSDSLTRRSAERMLQRGARKERWGYTFNRDVRLRYGGLELRTTEDLIFDMMDFSFRPNLLNIVATGSPYKKAESVRDRFRSLYRRKCPIFREVELQGTHHLHMNNPLPVAQEINQFLQLVKSQTNIDSDNSTLDTDSFNKL